MNTKRIILTGLAVGALALTACASDGAATGTGDDAGARVFHLTVSQSVEYVAKQTEGFDEVMKEAGVQVTTSTTDFDAAEQAQQVNQALSTNPDLIVIYPTDTTSIIPALERIREAGVPVVVTTYLPETEDTSLWNAWVGPDHFLMGEQAAEALVAGIEANNLNSNGGVLEVTGTPGAGATIERAAGFQAKLAELAPSLKYLGSQPGNWDQTEATTATGALLAQFGAEDIVGLFAHADNMVAGSITAAQQADYSPGEDLILVGADCAIEGYTNIEKGLQFGTTLQNPVAEGRSIAETALAVLAGEEVENIIYIDTPLITDSNLADCASAVGK